MKNLFEKRVTIYNDIPSDAVNPRRFEKTVINKCTVQGGFVEKADGTIQNVVNAITLISKDVERYRNPEDYSKMPIDMREDLYTVQVDDFIVFDEVDDIVTTSKEFQELQKKYSRNGMLVSSVTPSINGLSVDNVTITNV